MISNDLKWFPKQSGQTLGSSEGMWGPWAPGAGGLSTPALPDTDSRREQMPDAKGLVGVSVCALWCRGGLGREQGVQPGLGQCLQGQGGGSGLG